MCRWTCWRRMSSSTSSRARDDRVAAVTLSLMSTTPSFADMESGVNFASRRIHVHQMGVLPQWRGHGIGAELMDRAKEYAREMQAPTMVLEVWEFNVAARRFYRHEG